MRLMLQTGDQGRPCWWRWHSRYSRHTTASLVALLLAVALAACDQAAASHGASAGTPTAPVATETLAATATPTPLTFPKQWADASIETAPGQLAFAPSDSTRGYACDPTKGQWGATTKPFAATSDGGVSWTLIAGAPFGTGGCAVFVDQTDPADVFVQSYGAASSQIVSWRSRDSGATWHQLGPVTLNQHDAPWTAVAVAGARIVIAAGAPATSDGPGQLPPNDLFASDDGGGAWQQIGQSIASQNLDVRNLIAFESTLVVRAHLAGGCCGDAAPLYRATSSASRPPVGNAHSGGPAPNLYFTSSDGGRTWARMNLPAEHIVTLRAALSPVGAYYLVAFADNVDPSNLTAGSIYYSADGGAH